MRRRLGALICGLVVVRRDVPRGGHELAPLARQRSLLAAVEEVGHVGVLLGLGHVQLEAPACASTTDSVVCGCSAANTTG